jgi:hypothetical protein
MKKKNDGGDCYVVAGRFALELDPTINFQGTAYLVHAEVQGQGAIKHLRYGHAWIEDSVYVYDYSNGRNLKFPKELYYLVGDVNTEDPTKYRSYTFKEARKRMVETRHFGPWDIEVEYEEGGIVKEPVDFLLAPNGRPSNLTPEQWKLVRTPEFKAWFGDWENQLIPFQEVFQKRYLAIDKLKDSGAKGLKINSDATVKVYHGTSRNNADEIKSDGFNSQSYFSVHKGGTNNGDSPLDVAKRKHGNEGTVMEINIDPIYLETAAGGSELYSPYKLVNLGTYYGIDTDSSKVVDENGEPMVVYHGTGTHITVFDKKKAHDKEGRAAGVGYGKGKFYFTTAYDSAKSWAERSVLRGDWMGKSIRGNKYGSGESPNIISAFVRIIKPMSFEAYSDMLRQKNEAAGYDGYRAPQQVRDKNIAEIDKYMKLNKYDGIFEAYNPQVVLFNSNQIKLADGSNTTFDANNPDIRLEKGGLTGLPERAKTITTYNDFGW